MDKLKIRDTGHHPAAMLAGLSGEALVGEFAGGLVAASPEKTRDRLKRGWWPNEQRQNILLGLGGTRSRGHGCKDSG